MKYAIHRSTWTLLKNAKPNCTIDYCMQSTHIQLMKTHIEVSNFVLRFQLKGIFCRIYIYNFFLCKPCIIFQKQCKQNFSFTFQHFRHISKSFFYESNGIQFLKHWAQFLLSSLYCLYKINIPVTPVGSNKYSCVSVCSETL